MYTTQQIRELIRTGRIEDFYNDRAWRTLAEEVRRDQHHECQMCKAKGAAVTAAHVHHVMHVKDHPELAYSKVYIDEHGKPQRNLIVLCHKCHEEQHPERFKHYSGHYTNDERW